MIGIVIVNYNGLGDTINCVRSIQQSDIGVPYTILIVDNCSYGNDVSEITNIFKLHKFILSEKYDFKYNILSNYDKNIFLIVSDKNGGFAYANNIGIQLLILFEKFKYIWLLNNDTTVDKRAMSFLYKYHEQLPQDVGIIGNKLLFFDDCKKIQAIGGKYDKILARSSHIGAYELDNGQYDSFNIQMDYIVGASMFVKTDFIRDVGLMTDDYFLYFEELDWILRGRRRGWKIGYTPEAVVYHKEGGSTIENRNGLKSKVADVCLLKNRVLFTRRFFPKNIFTVYIGCVITIIRRVTQGHFCRACILIKALYSTFKYNKLCGF